MAQQQAQAVQATPNADPRVENATRMLPVALPANEMEKLAKTQSAAVLEEQRLLDEKRETASRFTKLIKEQQALAKDAADKINAGAAKEPVACTKFVDVENGRVWWKRLDTGEQWYEIATKNELEASRQERMPLEDEGAPSGDAGDGFDGGDEEGGVAQAGDGGGY